jgi:hypothetical protein
MPYPAKMQSMCTLRFLPAERERRPAEGQEQFASSGTRISDFGTRIGQQNREAETGNLKSEI